MQLETMLGGFYVDCDRPGLTILVFQDVDGVMKRVTSDERDTSRIAQWVVKCGERIGVNLKVGKLPVTIKGIGIGAGVIDLLVREGVLVVSHVPCKAEGEQYQVVKAHAACTIRDRIDRLERELGKIKAELVLTGRT